VKAVAGVVQSRQHADELPPLVVEVHEEACLGFNAVVRAKESSLKSRTLAGP
jgi:hypothetical protein